MLCSDKAFNGEENNLFRPIEKDDIIINKETQINLPTSSLPIDNATQDYVGQNVTPSGSFASPKNDGWDNICTFR